MQAVFSTESSGRVLKYDSRTKATEVLVQGLHFPNGITLSKDHTFFIYASCAGRYTFMPLLFLECPDNCFSHNNWYALQLACNILLLKEI